MFRRETLQNTEKKIQQRFYLKEHTMIFRKLLRAIFPDLMRVWTSVGMLHGNRALPRRDKKKMSWFVADDVEGPLNTNNFGALIEL